MADCFVFLPLLPVRKQTRLLLNSFTAMFLVEIKHKKLNPNSVQQQREHHHYRKYSSRAFICDVAPLDLVDSSGFRSFLGLVRFAFGTERVKKSERKKRERAFLEL